MPPAAVNRRRQIVRACKQRGWRLQPAALKGMDEYLLRMISRNRNNNNPAYDDDDDATTNDDENDRENDDASKHLHDLLDRVAVPMQAVRSVVVSALIWEQIVHECNSNNNRSRSHSHTLKNYPEDGFPRVVVHTGPETAWIPTNRSITTRRSATTLTSFPDVQIIGAFQTPKLVYRVMRKQFDVEISYNKWSLFGSATDKVGTTHARAFVLCGMYVVF
jgi:hypothetical protein